MKKVLIIGNFWPFNPSGSKRIFGLAKYLPAFGWDPIILTQPLKRLADSRFRVIETDYRGFMGRWSGFFGALEGGDFGEQLKEKYKDIRPKSKFVFRFLYRLIREVLAYPDEHKNWKNFALKHAVALIQREELGAIISVYPLTSHLIANELRRNYGIPWIADLTDLWSDNSAYIYSWLRKYFDRRLEAKTLSLADSLTTSSAPLAEKLKRYHRNAPVFTIWLGYDPEMTNFPTAELTYKLTITYTGFLYPHKRDPEKFFVALSNLLSRGTINPEDIEVRFFTDVQKEMEDKILKYELSNVVDQYHVVPLEECVRRQHESQVLLQLNWEDPNEEGVFSGKLFDYLAARRPILAAGGAGKDVVVKEIISKTSAGVYAASVSEIEKCLNDFYSEYKRKGRIEYRGNEQEVNRFSAYESAHQFAKLLSSLRESD